MYFVDHNAYLAKINRLKNMDNHYETCRTHCCVLHGCKYGDSRCPVVKREVKQAYPCMDCTNNKIPNLDDPNYDLRTMSHKELIRECKRLRRLLNGKTN